MKSTKAAGILTIISGLVIGGGAAAGVYSMPVSGETEASQTNAEALTLKDNIFTFEYGQEVPSDPAYYLLDETDPDVLSMTQLVLPNSYYELEYPEVGKEKATIVWKDQQRDFTIIVKDSTPPEFISFEEEREMEPGTKYPDWEKLYEISDLSKCRLETEKVDVSKEGSYRIRLKAIDEYNNINEKTITVNVIDPARKKAEEEKKKASEKDDDADKADEEKKQKEEAAAKKAEEEKKKAEEAKKKEQEEKKKQQEAAQTAQGTTAKASSLEEPAPVPRGSRITLPQMQPQNYSWNVSGSGLNSDEFEVASEAVDLIKNRSRGEYELNAVVYGKSGENADTAKMEDAIRKATGAQGTIFTSVSEKEDGNGDIFTVYTLSPYDVYSTIPTVSEKENAISTVISEAGLHEDMTQKQAVKAINGWIRSHIQASRNGYDLADAVSEGHGNSATMAEILSEVCNAIGMDADVISGTDGNSSVSFVRLSIDNTPVYSNPWGYAGGDAGMIYRTELWEGYTF